MDFKEFVKYLVIKDKNGNEYPLNINNIQLDYVKFISWCGENGRPATMSSYQEWLGVETVVKAMSERAEMYANSGRHSFTKMHRRSRYKKIAGEQNYIDVERLRSYFNGKAKTSYVGVDGHNYALVDVDDTIKTLTEE